MKNDRKTSIRIVAYTRRSQTGYTYFQKRSRDFSEYAVMIVCHAEWVMEAPRSALLLTNICIEWVSRASGILVNTHGEIIILNRQRVITEYATDHSHPEAWRTQQCGNHWSKYRPYAAFHTVSQHLRRHSSGGAWTPLWRHHNRSPQCHHSTPRSKINDISELNEKVFAARKVSAQQVSKDDTGGWSQRNMEYPVDRVTFSGKEDQPHSQPPSGFAGKTVRAWGCNPWNSCT